MTKKELLEILNEFPEDYDLVFTQETEKNAGDVYDMYLDNVTTAPGLKSIFQMDECRGVALRLTAGHVPMGRNRIT